MNPHLPSCFGTSGQTYQGGEDSEEEEQKAGVKPKTLKEVDLQVKDQLIQKVESVYAALKA